MYDNHMEPREAIDIIKRMYKERPTTDQVIALDMAYAALGKQIPEEVTDIHVDVIFVLYVAPKIVPVILR